MAAMSSVVARHSRKVAEERQCPFVGLGARLPEGIDGGSASDLARELLFSLQFSNFVEANKNRLRSTDLRTGFGGLATVY